MNWLTMKLTAARRWAVDILMATFLILAVVGGVVLVYFAAR